MNSTPEDFAGRLKTLLKQRVQPPAEDLDLLHYEITALFDDLIMECMPPKEHLQDNPEKLEFIERWNAIRRGRNSILHKYSSNLRRALGEK